jgi:hypothetical protein
MADKISVAMHHEIRTQKRRRVGGKFVDFIGPQ